MHCKKKCDVDSGSKLQVQKKSIQSSSLFSLKWLNPNLNVVSNLIPDGLWILYKVQGCDLISFSKLLLKTESGEF